MCATCGRAFAVLQRAAGRAYADFFLWEFTPFPCGAATDIAPKLRREAKRIRGWRTMLRLQKARRSEKDR